MKQIILLFVRIANKQNAAETSAILNESKNSSNQTRLSRINVGKYF